MKTNSHSKVGEMSVQELTDGIKAFDQIISENPREKFTQAVQAHKLSMISTLHELNIDSRK